jgi:hypothetical protein
MTEAINSVNFILHNDPAALLRNHHEGIKSAGHSVKEHVIDQTQKNSSIQNHNVANQLLLKNLHCVKKNQTECNVNILNNKVSQLKCEINNTILDAIKKYRQIAKGNRNERDHSQGESENDYDVLIESQVEAYVKLLLFKMQVILMDKGVMGSYKLVTIYDLNISSIIKYKQVFTIVPYKYGRPLNSISEIFKIDNQGNIKTINMPSRVIDGEYNYLGDWVNMCVRNESQNSAVQELSVKYGLKSLKGYSITCDPERQHIFKHIAQSIYISNFKKIW